MSTTTTHFDLERMNVSEGDDVVILPGTPTACITYAGNAVLGQCVCGWETADYSTNAVVSGRIVMRRMTAHHNSHATR